MGMSSFPETRHSMVVRMRENHDQGWEVFFRAYYQPALEHLKHLGCRDGDLAHDIFQEVTIYWRSHSLGYVPGQAKFRTFLRRALEYRLKDEWDRQNAAKRGSGARPVSLDQTPDGLTDGAGSLHDLIADPRRSTRWMDVEKLREYMFREVFRDYPGDPMDSTIWWLREIHGESNGEVARREGKSDGWASQAFARAAEWVRKFENDA